MLSLVSSVCVWYYTTILQVSPVVLLLMVCVKVPTLTLALPQSLFHLFFYITVNTTTVNYYMRWNERKLFNSVSFVFLMATSYIPCQLARVLGSSNPKKIGARIIQYLQIKRRSRQLLNEPCENYRLHQSRTNKMHMAI